MEVIDESIVVDSTMLANWDTQDGCELYVSWGHDEDVSQFSIYGDHGPTGGTTVAVHRQEHRIVYEWRVPWPAMPVLTSHAMVGFDVTVCDRDRDGSFTWQAWGRGEQKTTVPGRVGDLLFSAIDTGRLEGTAHTSSGVPAAALLVQVVSRDDGGPTVTTRTDDDGRFALDLPTGDYHAYATHAQRHGDRRDRARCNGRNGSDSASRRAVGSGDPRQAAASSKQGGDRSGSSHVADHVATLSPVTTVGEMGIVTRQVRRATVATLEASNVLVIKRTAFESVLSADKAAEARIYRNIVDILADKIVQDNVRTRDYLVEKVRQEERIREARRRADLALELVVSEAGMDRTRAQAIIDDHIDNEPRLRVLIVDDEAEMRRMLCDALADYDTSEARDGEEALEEIGDDPPDLVITDIRMPGMDGYELVRKLKERSPETPVLAISGYVSDADIVDYEFDAFLEKPMNLKEFRDFVDVALAEEE